MYEIICGDALAELRKLKGASVDAVFTDPPYAEVDRPYGRITESEWLEYMKEIVLETRRVLTPAGSAVMVLQPNSSKLGCLRPWLWEFSLWAMKEWNVVQDLYWFNWCALPICGANRYDRLLRPSVKPCLWLGSPDCYRDQQSVLLPEALNYEIQRKLARSETFVRPSTLTVNEQRIYSAAKERGGVIPFNMIPSGNAHGSGGHPAATPLALCEFFVRYLCPPGGLVVDPFSGSGTTGVACLRHGRSFLGIERESGFVQITFQRLAEEEEQLSKEAIKAAA